MAELSWSFSIRCLLGTDRLDNRRADRRFKPVGRGSGRPSPTPATARASLRVGFAVFGRPGWRLGCKERIALGFGGGAFQGKVGGQARVDRGLVGRRERAAVVEIAIIDFLLTVEIDGRGIVGPPKAFIVLPDGVRHLARKSTRLNPSH